MNRTKIEWTDYTWNPVTGCTKISQGCKHCYAEVMTRRFSKVMGSFKDVKLHHERLDQPKALRKPAKIFVCDVSDLFHEDVDFGFIHSVFRVMMNTPQHTYQVLTKRIKRALEFSNWLKFKYSTPFIWPSNVWIGTSCENQKTAELRIPFLIQIPATVRFLSCEPLISSIDLIPIPFFFKQWGAWAPEALIESNDDLQICLDTDAPGVAVQLINIEGKHNSKIFIDGVTEPLVRMLRVGKGKAGNLLDGKTHLNFPL